MKYSIINNGDAIFVSFSKPINETSLIGSIRGIEGVFVKINTRKHNEIIIQREPYVTILDIRTSIEYWLTANCEEFEYVEAYS